MKMKMEDRLFSHLTRRADEIHPLGLKGRTDRRTDPHTSAHDVARKREVGLPEIGDVLARHDQGVPAGGGRGREERQPVRLLADNLDGLQSGSDRAEVAIVVPCSLGHRSRPQFGPSVRETGRWSVCCPAYAFLLVSVGPRPDLWMAHTPCHTATVRWLRSAARTTDTARPTGSDRKDCHGHS